MGDNTLDIVDVRDTGISADNYARLEEVMRNPNGIILVTGPTGSGKSTTIYAVLHQLSTPNVNVVTIEDPVEYLHPHKRCMVNQREIGRDAPDFAQALRSALREDPDVILVGEMRDLETISAAVTAAETGHLVISTLHTLGASNTIDRIVDAFPPEQQQQIRTQLALVLEGVVSQQLLPTVRGDIVPAFEIMRLNSAIRTMIREAKLHQVESVILSGAKEGMVTMDTSLKRLYDEGVISRETAVRYSTNPERMESKV